MKYIRTEDGRIAEIKGNMFVKQCNDALRLVYKDRPCICVLNGNDNIIKQADNIKELCDEFVAVNKKYNSHRLTNIYKDEYYKPRIPMYYAGQHTHDFVDDFIRNKGQIYGAVWTEWGLKYAARMNEKGELEEIK